MNLSSLLPIIEEMPAYHPLVRGLEGQRGRHRVTVPDAAKPYLLAALFQELRRPLLVITPQPEDSRKLYDQLLSWCPSPAHVQLFPEPDALPYERLNSDLSTVRERLRTLSDLSRGGQAFLIVASASALVRKTIPYSDFISACQEVRQGERGDPLHLLTQCHAIGYETENAVEVPGTIARRGGIIDLYPPNLDLPARIEFFGDEIESLRLFDTNSQRSTQSVPSITITPAREFLLPERGDQRRLTRLLSLLDFSGCPAAVRERIEEEITMLLEGQWLPGHDFYAPLFNTGTVFDYVPSTSLLILDEPADIEIAVERLDEQAAEMRKEQEERGELPLNFPRSYITWAQLSQRMEEVGQCLTLERWPLGGEEQPLTFSAPPGYGGRLQILLKEAREMLRKRQRLLVISHQASRLSELFAEQDIFAPPLPRIEQPPLPGSVALIQGSLAEGWVMTGGDSPVVLLTDNEIFGFVKQRRLAKRRPVHIQAFLSELSLGDYVVHIEHGIARFAGMTRMHIDNTEREHLILQYAAGDKLYLPSDQIDRVSRYIGPRDAPPALTRLGGREWARTKQRVRESAESIAGELLDLYAAREVIPGIAFPPDMVWQQELEASFPYIETPDQLETIMQVKEDMERPRPMDRLICGDVGYGKTEVALRAAFKAVLDGVQVAMVVPTTVLAQQHFATFSGRLAAFPVRVEMLSRFRSEKDQLAVLEGLTQGTVDICIGTHRLLQQDVFIKNLGLVIIDEEQRFGVAHKERLKQMRREVDVLTLTATPIPRTLHMSLAGVRDMSTIETPPEERLPIKTYVAEYDERLIREAILRELERNGQVFFVHNRVQTISALASKLAATVPEARIAVAHGQMPGEQLERVMMDFAAGEDDVLMCTTIIESGLDMPNVNTLIVNDSDKMGLTQLYQLRGRVGRGVNRAYAYFLFDRGKRLTEKAQKRLKTIFEATELGAGFRVAMKDLEIRGAGNLLGVEQSGHIGAVGFDLYCRLLAEAVEELRSKQQPEEAREKTFPPSATTIDLPLVAHMPEDYVSDLSTRLALYQRMARLESVEEIDGMIDELSDRFGPLPLPVENLFYVVKMKILAAGAEVQTVSTEGGQITLRLRGDKRLDRSLEFGYGDEVKVGTSQVRLNIKRLGSKWPQVLEEVLNNMRSQFKERPP
ncbi:transcription-repair coupling factor [Chloroflexota bacterium]